MTGMDGEGRQGLITINQFVSDAMAAGVLPLAAPRILYTHAVLPWQTRHRDRPLLKGCD